MSDSETVEPAASAPEAAPPTLDRSPAKDKRRWRLSTAALAAIIALGSSVVGLLFTLAPSLKPDPGNSINAEMKVLTVDPNVTYHQLLHRFPNAKALRKSPYATDPDIKDTPGVIAYTGITVDGRKRHDLQLRTSVYVAKTHRRVGDASNIDADFKSDTPSDHWVATPWAADPGLHKPYFVRVELWDRDVMLAYVDTRRLQPAP
ncbi:MAG: hypothetical protein JWN65_2701 [Solirubrobacterales bacterium]|nr:hypothetical protein [Solirubrobacterales bacterium]